MSSMKFKSLMSEFPEEHDALKRLESHLSEVQERATKAATSKELTLQRLYELAGPSSQRVLVSILTRLCQQGVVSRSVRVESPEGQAIGDFASVLDVPEVIRNFRDGQNVNVSVDSLKMVYTVSPLPSKTR